MWHSNMLRLKTHQSQPNIYTLFWRFDLITRSSSEEAGTQLFWVLIWVEKDYGRQQRTRPSYQVDQGSCTYPQGRSSSYESRRGQLSVESRLRPLSWCATEVFLAPRKSFDILVLYKSDYYYYYYYATADRRIKTRKNWVPASSDEDLMMRSKRQNKV